MVSKAYKLDEELRTECGHVLEEILERHSDEDYEKLTRSLHPDTEVGSVQQLNALHLLGRWGNPGAVPIIVQLMPRLSERDLVNAVNALGQLGGPDALRTIEEHISHPSADVRRFVASALKQVGSQEALDKLNVMGNSDASEMVRLKAARLLRK